MKILWLGNIELPVISEARGKKKNPVGGWLTGYLTTLIADKNVEFVYLYPDAQQVEGTAEKVRYYSFLEGDSTSIFFQILQNEKPDIIHIFGTEFGHSYDMTVAAKKIGFENRVIISIQGMVSIYAKHYCAGLPNSVIHHYTLRDFLKHDNIYWAMNKYFKRGKKEVSAIQNVKYLIGRTDWDKACTHFINSSAKYYYCNETLRDSFYNRSWNVGQMERHSIFVSQCSYPIKGFHFVLEALPQVLNEYPDAHLFTTGHDLLKMTKVEKLKISSYQSYLMRLIRKYNLEEHISFLGTLSEAEMCNYYCKSNVFVSASTIENSPNSVGEAMMVGCPVVTSDVGGVKNMLTHGQEGFVYQTDAPYMLAFYINQIFSDDELAMVFSANARVHAHKTHNMKNSRTLLRIYEDVQNNE